MARIHDALRRVLFIQIPVQVHRPCHGTSNISRKAQRRQTKAASTGLLCAEAGLLRVEDGEIP